MLPDAPPANVFQYTGDGAAEIRRNKCGLPAVSDFEKQVRRPANHSPAFRTQKRIAQKL
jgi:hypothetical protein